VWKSLKRSILIGDDSEHRRPIGIDQEWNHAVDSPYCIDSFIHLIDYEYVASTEAELLRAFHCDAQRHVGHTTSVRRSFRWRTEVWSLSIFYHDKDFCRGSIGGRPRGRTGLRGALFLSVSKRSLFLFFVPSTIIVDGTLMSLFLCHLSLVFLCSFLGVFVPW
jgi:hypothetical protein